MQDATWEGTTEIAHHPLPNPSSDHWGLQIFWKRNNHKLMLPLHPQKQRKAALTQEESALEEKVILLGPAWHFPNSGPHLLGRDITSSHPPQPFFLWRIMKLGKNVKKQCNEHLHRLHGDITVVNTLLHWHSPALSTYTYICAHTRVGRYIHTDFPC